MNIVQVTYKNSNLVYTFEVPKGVKLYKGDLVQTHKGLDIAECVTDSEEVSDNVIKMIMGHRKITAKIVGKYTLTPFGKENDERPNS